MDLTVASGTYIATNKIFYVLTWLNITEEMTKKKVNENIPNPADISDSSSSESSEEDIVLSVRSSSKKKEPENVPGVTNYGSLCSVWGAGAIGRDDGRYFSGVSTAALQVATALGQMYNGSIVRRTCDEYYVESSSEFHKTQCHATATKQEEDFDCLKEAVVAVESAVKTPSEFFLRHNEWTPCKVSYIGSHKCDLRQKKEKCPYNRWREADKVGLHFKELTYPAIKIVYLGSRNLTEDEESQIIGSFESGTEITVKGGNALNKIMVIPLEMEDESFISGNKLILVLTGLNITEQKTRNGANSATSIPHSTDTDGGNDYDDYDTEPRARSALKKKIDKNVGGLSQYGTICGLSGAIVQDYGSNFSGVAAAAQQVANVLGPMYNGTIARRNCSDEDYALPTFHGEQCGSLKNLLHEKEQYDCLKDSIDGMKAETMTPHQFYKKHPDWTPCRTSYLGTQECTETRYQHKNCSISCCMETSFYCMKPTYPISAPDGEQCESNKICVGGKCIAKLQP
uniref:Putative metalloprotease n=1 Tax=Ixodes ricinus TaxID=34613 RepID=A0A0K8RAS7_IXORI